MEKADQSDRPECDDSRSKQDHDKADQSTDRECCKHTRRSDSLHHVGPRKSSNHKPDQVRLQIERGGFLGKTRRGILRESNYEAGDPNLGTNVAKLGNDPFHEMTAPQYRTQFANRGLLCWLLSLFSNLRKVGESNHYGD